MGPEYRAVLERNTQAIDRNTRAWGHAVAGMRSIADHLDSRRVRSAPRPRRSGA